MQNLINLLADWYSVDQCNVLLFCQGTVLLVSSSCVLKRLVIVYSSIGQCGSQMAEDRTREVLG